MQGFWQLTNGISSHNAIARIFAVIDPQALQQCFLSWVQAATQSAMGGRG
ncbi:transposase family protein [Thermosynechococcus sp.]